MSTINTSFPNFFADAALILGNSREQPEIATALDAFLTMQLPSRQGGL